MNFLSHYYFERFAIQPEQVTGCILPDLLKNASRDYAFRPEKRMGELEKRAGTLAIYEGWKRHVEVDRLFHGSSYFIDHCHVFRQRVIQPLQHTEIRTTFFAHVALELCLDHLLIREQLVNVDRLYENLEATNPYTLKRFLHIIGLEDTSKYFYFHERFMASRYIHQYAEVSSLVSAIVNVCRRLWTFSISEEEKTELTLIFENYIQNNLQDYREIFQYIQDRLLAE